MEYLRVKPASNQVRKNPRSFKNCDILIANELYTRKEIEKQTAQHLWTDTFINKHFEVLELSKTRVHFLFGARFQSN